MKKSLALILLLPLLSSVFVQQPAQAWPKIKIKTPEFVKKMDPTVKDSVTRQAGRDIDPTARNAKYGGVTRAVCDTAANVVTKGGAGTACSDTSKRVGEINRQIRR
jgi:hypothetical protein